MDVLIPSDKEENFQSIENRLIKKEVTVTGLTNLTTLIMRSPKTILNLTWRHLYLAEILFLK